jgi:hypothetical protein
LREERDGDVDTGNGGGSAGEGGGDLIFDGEVTDSCVESDGGFGGLAGGFGGFGGGEGAAFILA